MDNKKLFVGGLPYSVRDDELREHFSQAGEVTSASVIMERDTGRSKGFGFVEMATEEAAQKAIEMFHEAEMAGRRIIVNVARPKEERPRNDRQW
jgi:RNA recognition motif-containing protein